MSAAVAIADTEGIGAVTMRRLGSAVGVEAMSLYHHLPGKEALLDGVVDTVIGEVTDAIGRVESAEPAANWQSTLRRRFLTARSVMLAHPWAPGLIGTRTTVPASVYGYYDGLLATMVEGGFSYHLAHQALHSFGSMPLGFVQELFSPAAGAGDADVDVAAEELAQMADLLPHVTAMVAAEIHDHDGDMLGWCDGQTEFEFTLDLLIDGLERASRSRDVR